MRSRAVLPAFSLLLVVGVSSCGDGPILGTEPPADSGPDYHFDFTEDSHGWYAGFADYPPHMEEVMDLVADYRPLPSQVGTDGRGLYVAGTNHSDDLFMFWAGRMGGLQPETAYGVRFTVEFASEAPSGCFGIGGAPAEAVTLKAGASAIRPQPVLGSMGSLEYMVMNIDKGVQSTRGDDALVLGHIGNTKRTCHSPAWETVRVESDEWLEVVTDDEGGAWLIVGTDSGFEGRNRLYYTGVGASFEPL